jgi:hypothetical protein
LAFPSTFVQLQNSVIAKVRLHATDDLTKTKDWINQVYADTCIETEAVQSTTTISLTGGTAIYTLATGIVRIKALYVTPVGGTRSAVLQPTSIEQIVDWKVAGSANAGTVTHYAVFGVDQIEFYPTPSSNDTVTAYYVKLPTALTADADVPVLQEPYVTECLENGAAYKAAVFLKDPDAMLFKQDYETAKQRLRGHLHRKQGAMTQQFRITKGTLGVPHDPSTDLR